MIGILGRPSPPSHTATCSCTSPDGLTRRVVTCGTGPDPELALVAGVVTMLALAHLTTTATIAFGTANMPGLLLLALTARLVAVTAVSHGSQPNRKVSPRKTRC